MLDRVAAVELVANVIERTVQPYMREHHFSPNETLFHYIENLVGTGRKRRPVLGVGPCEAKAIAVINCITSSKVLLVHIFRALLISQYLVFTIVVAHSSLKFFRSLIW